jgi:hypothetical protein
MGLDIRIPIGLLFVILGILLTFYGLITVGNEDLYKRSLDINVNLWWGLVMFGFGTLMGVAGWRKTASSPPG